MYDTILLAIALQRWEHYSAHALAARDVALAIARGASKRLHVLSAYTYEDMESVNLPEEMAARHREDMMSRTDRLMERKMADYVAPLKQEDITVIILLRAENPRHAIIDVATDIMADLLIIGCHSKRGIMDIALGSTAQHISRHAPCPLLLVSPQA